VIKIAVWFLHCPRLLKIYISEIVSFQSSGEQNTKHNHGLRAVISTGNHRLSFLSYSVPLKTEMDTNFRNVTVIINLGNGRSTK
jgi:hypothetical protein